MEVCKMMQSMKIVICGTGPTLSNCSLIMSIYFNSNITSQPFLTNLFPCYILTIIYIRSSGVTLSNTCSEIYCLHIWTPHLSLQHTSVLQAHCGEHSDREFSNSLDTNLQYSYNIACTVTFTLKCSVLVMATVTLKSSVPLTVTVTLLLTATLQW
jgi:hypothetical protein